MSSCVRMKYRSSGRAAVFPTEELYDPTKVSDITLDHVKTAG